MPIIHSLLDCDLYKFLAGQWVFFNFPDKEATYKLILRSKIDLWEKINIQQLKEELNFIRGLSFSTEDIVILSKTGYFKEEYLTFLRSLKLPPVSCSHEGVVCQGSWCEVIYWETLVLSVVNELYFQQSPYVQGDLHRGRFRLAEKINTIADNGLINFVEFGTRRRFSGIWQEEVLRTLKTSSLTSTEQFQGTSNVLFGHIFDIPVRGTMPHEVFMGTAALGDNFYNLKDPVIKVIDSWADLYGPQILLPDTFGSSFVLNELGHKAVQWGGFRQDSGSPFDFVDKVLACYRKHNINPKTKTIIFSDGLTVADMIKIVDYVDFRIPVSFGWGTNLTNDLGHTPLSMVMKLVEIDGFPVVKLSDDLSKSSGPESVKEHYKKVFNYAN